MVGVPAFREQRHGRLPTNGPTLSNPVIQQYSVINDLGSSGSPCFRVKWRREFLSEDAAGVRAVITVV